MQCHQFRRIVVGGIGMLLIGSFASIADDWTIGTVGKILTPGGHNARRHCERSTKQLSLYCGHSRGE